MTVRTGDKLQFEDLGIQLIVTAGGDATVTAAPGTDQLQVGKRYQCPDTGIQVLVVKPGQATLRCDDTEMVLQEAKKTKAAD